MLCITSRRVCSQITGLFLLYARFMFPPPDYCRHILCTVSFEGYTFSFWSVFTEVLFCVFIVHLTPNSVSWNGYVPRLSPSLTRPHLIPFSVLLYKTQHHWKNIWEKKNIPANHFYANHYTYMQHLSHNMRKPLRKHAYSNILKILQLK